jgi:2-oxoglutarate dehydrogenase E2 component (dihydrolipoamide succinyltransferase)
MPVEVKAPTVGESVSEIYIGQWRKAVGDRVEQDEPLVELESDKATLDLPAPASGVLAKILKQEGDSAEPGEAIAVIDDADRGETKKPKSNGARAESPATKKEVKAPKKEAEEAPKEKVAEEEKEEKESPPKAKADHRREPEPPPAPPSAPADAETAASDAASAQQGDRSVRAPDDEQRAEKATEAREPALAPVPKSKPAAETTPPAPARADDSAREERVPMSPLRRQIAHRLVDAQRDAALLTTFNEVDMTAVKALRAEFGE